jgi:hypothetical protein
MRAYHRELALNYTGHMILVLPFEAFRYRFYGPMLNAF